MNDTHNRTVRILIPTLILLGGTYLVLRPTLNRITGDAARLDRESAAKQAQATRSAQVRSELDNLKAAAASRRRPAMR